MFFWICLNVFDFQLSFAPQPCAHVQSVISSKPGPGMATCWRLWLPNVLRAAAQCHFCAALSPETSTPFSDISSFLTTCCNFLYGGSFIMLSMIQLYLVLIIINHIMVWIAVFVVPWSIISFMISWWPLWTSPTGAAKLLQDKWKKCKGAIPFTSKQKGVDPFPSAVMSPSSEAAGSQKPWVINNRSGIAMDSFAKKKVVIGSCSVDDSWAFLHSMWPLTMNSHA